MTTRTITLPNGRRMRVPENIQRIDCRSTHGWQVRYAGTKLFSDGTGSPVTSLRRAKEELAARIAKHLAPTRLNRTVKADKVNSMPLGLSGPVMRMRPGRNVREANLLVSIPRFGRKPRRMAIYIGNENTYTEQRLERAIARGLRQRALAEIIYRRDATAARRAGAA